MPRAPQGASNSVSQTGQQIVQRQLNIAPTLTIRPGFPRPASSSRATRPRTLWGLTWRS